VLYRVSAISCWLPESTQNLSRIKYLEECIRAVRKWRRAFRSS
jgi:hypothetical protein